MIHPQFGGVFPDGERRVAMRLNTRGTIQDTSRILVRGGANEPWHLTDVFDFSLDGVGIWGADSEMPTRTDREISLKIHTPDASRLIVETHGMPRWNQSDRVIGVRVGTHHVKQHLLAARDDLHSLRTFFAIAEADTSSPRAAEFHSLRLNQKIGDEAAFRAAHRISMDDESHAISYTFADTIPRTICQPSPRGRFRDEWIQAKLRRAVAIAVSGYPTPGPNDFAYLVVAATMAAGAMIFDLDLGEPLAKDTPIQLGLAVGAEIMQIRNPTWAAGTSVNNLVQKLSNPEIRLTELYRTLASYFCEQIDVIKSDVN